MKVHAPFAVILAIFLVLTASIPALAAEQPPTVCTQGSFSWVCNDGSENYMNVPPPPVSGHSGNGYFAPMFFFDAGLGANEFVQMGSGYALRFNTKQPLVAWWDANDVLHLAKLVNGTVTIPSSAVMAAVPGDILGRFAIPGWIKGQRTDTKEYVLGSTRFFRR